MIDNKDWLESEYNSGRSLQSIADECGICREALRLRFLKFGIIRRGHAEHLKGKEKPQSQKDKMAEARKEFWNQKDEDYRSSHKLKISKSKTIHGTMTDGRKRVYVLNRGVVLEYRLLIEQKIGRQLNPNEVIHHKDGDCTNNNINNLEVMTPTQHAKIHYAERVKNEKGQLV